MCHSQGERGQGTPPMPLTIIYRRLGMDPESQQALLQLQLWDVEEKEADRQHLTSYACPWEQEYCQGKSFGNISDNTSGIQNSRNQS